MADSMQHFERSGRLAVTTLSPSEQEVLAFIEDRKYDTHFCHICRENKTVGHFTAVRTKKSLKGKGGSARTCNECHIKSTANVVFPEESLEWHERAACNEALDKEIFFPASRAEAREFEVQYMDFCGSCPVKDECALWGEVTHSGGIWGGEFRPYASEKTKKATR